ncbi:hypothetical protein BDAP_000017 [Binucleata daphniae]
MQKRKFTDEHIQNYNDEMKYNDGTYVQVQKRKLTDEYMEIDNDKMVYNDGTYVNFTQKAEYNNIINVVCKNTEKIRNNDPTYYDCDSQHNKVSCTNNLHEGYNVKNNCFKPNNYDSNIIKEAYNNNQNNIYYNGKVKDITKQTFNRPHQDSKYHIKFNKLANNRSNNSFNSNNFLQSMEKQIENYKLKAKIHGWDDAKSAMIIINKSKIHDDMAEQSTTNTNQNEANAESTNNQIDINECINDYNCSKDTQNFSAKISDNKPKNNKTLIIKNRCTLAKRRAKKNSKKYKRNIVIEKDNSVNNCLDLSLFRKITFVPIYMSCKTNYKHSSTRVDFIKALSYFNLYYNIKMPCCSYFERLHEMIIFCMMNGGFMKVYKTKTLSKIVKSKKVILKYFLYVYPFEQYTMNASIIEVYEMRRSSCILNVKYNDTVNKIELLQKFLNINNFVEINKILKKIEEKSIEKPLYDFILNLAFTLTKKIFENKNIENNIYTFQEFIVKKNRENEILKKIANKEITKSEIRTIKRIQINEIRTSLKLCSYLILAYITSFTSNHAVAKNSCNQDCLLALQENNYSESLNIKDLNRLIFTLFKYKNRCENETRSILFENAFKAFEKLHFLYDFDCNMYKNTKNYINERTINSVFSYLSKTNMSKNIKRKIINKTTKYFDYEFNRIVNLQQNEVGSFDFNFHEQIVKFLLDIKRYRIKMVGITEKLIYNYSYTRNNETAVILEYIFSILMKYMKQPELVKIKEYIAKTQITKFDHYFTSK